jgi:hypothetical protein
MLSRMTIWLVNGAHISACNQVCMARHKVHSLRLNGTFGVQVLLINPKPSYCCAARFNATDPSRCTAAP